MRAAWLGVGLSLLVACGRDQPTRVRIVDDPAGNGTYKTRDVTLETIVDLQRVQGGAAQAFANALLDLDHDVADEGAARSDVVVAADDVRAQWVLDGDVAVPSDFDSLNLLSAYAHIEEAQAFFKSLGASHAADVVPLYYHPRITSADDATEDAVPDADNAAYFPLADALLLFPMVVLQDIPFPVNRGVMTHEYAHRVFYYEAWGGQMFATLIAALDQQDFYNVWNLIRAVDEGCSDYFGAALTGNPNFVYDSHSAGDRALDVVREVDANWTDGAQPTSGDVYDPYALGSVIASTLWGLADIAGTSAVSNAILDAQRDLAAALEQSFAYAVGDFEASVVAALPAAQRDDLCERALLSYAAVWDRFAAVCP